MKPRTLLGVVAPIVGLGASVASMIDYVSPATFCSEAGCATVRASAWSHPLGVPMPLVGVAYFAVMTALAFVDRPRLRRALALVGGAWALMLIALQTFVIGAWCKLCMIADPAAIVGALAIFAGATTVRPRWRHLAVAVPGLAGLAVALVALGHHATVDLPPGTPACIAAEQQPGVVTIVEFVDFECPFCRALAPKLSDAIGKATPPIRVVRKMVPLERHEHAMPAAIAWCCANAQGRGDDMAAALFAADPADLTPDGCEKIATRLGLDLVRYRTTFADPTTRAAIDRDVAEAHAAAVQGFPTVFIGGQRIEGADHSVSELVAAIDRAPR